MIDVKLPDLSKANTRHLISLASPNRLIEWRNLGRLHERDQVGFKGTVAFDDFTFRGESSDTFQNLLRIQPILLLTNAQARRDPNT